MKQMNSRLYRGVLAVVAGAVLATAGVNAAAATSISPASTPVAVTVAGATVSTPSPDRAPTGDGDSRTTHRDVSAEAKKKIPKWLRDLINKIPELPSKVKAGWTAFKKWYDGLPWWKKALIMAINPASTLQGIFWLLHDLLT